MTRQEAKKQLLGFLIEQLTFDDEAAFGPVGEDPESQEYGAMDGARKELCEEFKRRMGNR